jgi:phage terminase large subunit-like protein
MPPSKSPIQKKIDALRLAETYEKAGASLRAFRDASWPIIEARPFQHGWAVDAVCDHVEAAITGKLPRPRLIINVPPRSTKSTITTVMAPCWDWARQPERQWLTGSHNRDLAIRDNLKSRRILESQWYRTGWGHMWQMTSDQNQKMRYENNRNGYRVTFGFNSGVTGEGGDILLIDDPHPARASEIEIVNAVEFYDQELSTRLNDPSTGAIILIMQRLRENDLTGHILEKEAGWTHLCLPMEFDPARRCHTVLGFTDPRKEAGELLCKERFTPDFVRDVKISLGAWAASAQLDQNPVPRGGGDLTVDMFPTYDVLPPMNEWKHNRQFWDTAGTDAKTSSKWAGIGIIQTTDDHLWIYDLVHDRFTYPDGKKAMWEMYDRGQAGSVEVENKSTGISIFGDRGTDPMLRRMNISKVDPCKDKTTRMDTESEAIRFKKVHIPARAGWRPDFDKAIVHFPTGVNQDIIDVLSQGLAHFRKRRRPRIRTL